MTATAQASLPPPIPLGASVPALTAHAISVSLPTWDDNVGYEEGHKRVIDKMVTGYPRFFIHRSIQKLAALCLSKFGRPDELCMLFPSPRVAACARDFLASQSTPLSSRIVEFVVCPTHVSLANGNNPSVHPPTPSSSRGTPVGTVDVIELQILLFHKDYWPTAKAFWQHTGDGISSRRAERALAFLGETPAGEEASTSPSLDSHGPPQGKLFSSRNRHYSRHPSSHSSPVPTGSSSSATTSQPRVVSPMNGVTQQSRTTGPTSADNEEAIADEVLTSELATYLEERYGRNLPLFNAPLAKQALRRRIAGGLLPSDSGYGEQADIARASGEYQPLAASAVGGEKKLRRAATEDDVYLYPCGMSAIWHAHNLCRLVRKSKNEKEGKSICFGFPYTDTLKILQKWGPGSIFFGKGTNDEIDDLEKLLESRDPSTEPPFLSLFCEFPSNPLLRSPDLARLRALADKHGFIIVVDETIGNFINVEVTGLADIVVSSLTKVFSGDSNVMGGSLILNPNGPHYESLKSILASDYEDIYYPEDAVYLERNSRDYRTRIRIINDNAYKATSYLYSRSLLDTSTPAEGKALKNIYYPRWSTPENYASCQRKPTLGQGGFGGLFSVTFTSLAASKAFYDALSCAKGPSLGSSFTLASPYTILAHYYELDWAAGYGVEEGLVRISIGQEDVSVIMKMMEVSVEAAERAVAAQSG